ncbi:carcinine transporter [Trichonephila clavipes]|nr:carcinine transporter [Trichonephila clavipes]
MLYDYAACKRSLECLFGLGALGKIKFVEHTRSSASLWGGIPGHWCYIPEIAKSNLSLEMQKALIMPPSDPHCSMYDVNYTEILQSRNPNFNNETPTKPCDKGWFYENSEFDQTAVTEWDLVCKDDHYVNLLLSTTFMGIFLGSQFFSSLSSKIGRKPTFLISALIIAVADVGSSVNHNFVMVVLLRILQGTAVSSIYSTPYALSKGVY